MVSPGPPEKAALRLPEGVRSGVLGGQVSDLLKEIDTLRFSRLMNVEPTVLAVSSTALDRRLLQALERQGIYVEQVGRAELAGMLPLVAPDLVLGIGAEGVGDIVEILQLAQFSVPPKLALVVEPEAVPSLRHFHPQLIVTVLSLEVPAVALASRVASIARRLAARGASATATRPLAVPQAVSPAGARAAAVSSGPGEEGPPSSAKLRGLRDLRGSESRLVERLKPAPGPDLSVPPAPPAPSAQASPPEPPQNQRTSTDRSRWLRGGKAHRAVVADDHGPRAYAIAEALAERGLDVKVVPLDPYQTDWAGLQAHEPEVVITDWGSVASQRQIWLQLLQADAQLSSARVVKLHLERVFDEATEQVSLAALEPYIEELSSYRSQMPTVVADDDDDRPTLGIDDDDDRPTLGIDDDDDRPTLGMGDEDRPTLAMEEQVGGVPASPSAAAFPGASASPEPIEEFGDELDEMPTQAHRQSSDFDEDPMNSGGGWEESSPRVDFTAADPIGSGPATVQLSESVIFESQAYGGQEASTGRQGEPSTASPSAGGSMEDAASAGTHPLGAGPAGAGDSASFQVPVTVDSSPLASSPAAVRESSEGAPSGGPSSGSSPAALSQAAGMPAAGSPVGSPVVPPSARPGTVPSSRPPARPGPPHSSAPTPSSGGRGWGKRLLIVCGLLGVAGAGTWFVAFRSSELPEPVASLLGLSKSQSEPSDEAAPDLEPPQPPEEPSPAAEEPAINRWVLPAREVPSCQELVDGPAQITGAAIERGARAWQRARKRLVLGDREGARKQLCIAALNNPQSLALEGLVSHYLALDAPREALRWSEKALEIRGDRTKTAQLHGDVLSQLGKEEEARKTWISALEIEPGDQKTAELVADSYLAEAERALTDGDLPRAEVMARRAAGLDPESVAASAMMAEVFLEQGHREHAALWAERCQEQEADAPTCLIARGELAHEAGEIDTARALYKKATDLDPGNKRAWRKLSRLGDQ